MSSPKGPDAQAAPSNAGPRGAAADAEAVSHTPGPWRQSPGGYIHGSDCIVAKVGSFEDAELAPQSGARWIADARLIAAAPDMLAALRVQHRALDLLMAILIQRDPTFLPTESPAWPAVVQGNEAIKKAEGRNV